MALQFLKRGIHVIIDLVLNHTAKEHAWAKKAAKIPTDIDENIVRDLGLTIGLVDVKVAAVDATWSGLKFVYRVKDR